jgi:hypothetical protein
VDLQPDRIGFGTLAMPRRRDQRYAVPGNAARRLVARLGSASWRGNKYQ